MQVNNLNETKKAFGVAVSSFSDAYSFGVFKFNVLGNFTVSLTTRCYAGAVFLHCSLKFGPISVFRCESSEIALIKKAFGINVNLKFKIFVLRETFIFDFSEDGQNARQRLV